MSDAVIPSHLSMYFPYDDGAGGSFSADKMMVGEVQEVIYPDDERNLSGKFTEYVYPQSELSEPVQPFHTDWVLTFNG